MKAAIYIRVSTKEQKQIFDQAGILPHIQTPRGGFHYWFRYPGYYVKTLAGLLPGVDIRGDGGFVNVIGKRRDGEYKCLIVPIPENIYPWEKLPPVISEAIRANNNGHTQPFPVSTNTIPEGQRNQRLTQFAGAMRRQGMNEEAIETALQTTNKTQCNPPLPDDEVAGIVKSIMRYTPAPPLDNRTILLRDSPVTASLVSERDKSVTKSVTREGIETWVRDTSGWFTYEEVDKELDAVKKIIDKCHAAGDNREDAVTFISSLPVNGETNEAFEYIDLVYKKAPAQIQAVNFTDAENGEYFTAMYGDKLRYDHRRGRWLEWRGHYWRPDSDGMVMRLALKAMRTRFNDTTNISDFKNRDKVTTKAIQSEQRARLDATLALARNFKPIADNGESWDKNPWLFAVKNGVIDLQTGELKQGEQLDMITMISPVEFNPDAKAPRWEQFLNEIFANDNELITWLKKYFGYVLTGFTKEQVIPIGYGHGANGKTVLLNTTEYILGEYAYNAPFSTFELNNRSNIPNDIAALDGKRYVTARETTEGSRFNEGRIKALTGGDSITARYLHCEFFTYKPVAKFFLAVNTRPRVYDDSYGFWRRVRLIPFTRTFKDKADDKELEGKLLAESSGILNWMIQGCLLWKKDGLDQTPESIITATKEYESESDPLIDFIQDECVISEQAHIQSSRLYKAYKEWCRDQGMQDKEILSLNAFGRRLGKNYKKSHKEGGAVYQGLAMKADGFLTDSKAMFTENNVSPPIALSRRDNCENTSESVITLNNPSGDDLPPYPEKDCPKCGGEWTLNIDCTKYKCSECGFILEK